jgi:hypothetical protein
MNAEESAPYYGHYALRYYGDGVDGAPTGINVPRWSLSQPI